MFTLLSPSCLSGESPPPSSPKSPRRYEWELRRSFHFFPQRCTTSLGGNSRENVKPLSPEEPIHVRYLRTVHASQLSRGGGSETRKGRNKLRDGTDGNGACLPTHMQLTSFSFPTRECCFSTHALVSFSFPGLLPSCWGRSPPPPPRPCCLRTSPGRPGTFWPC